MAYNGWTNYETWLVSLWIHNDEPMYKYWRSQTEIAGNEARRDTTPDDVLTPHEVAIYNLAEQLKDEISSHCTYPIEPGVALDLMRAALTEVNWKEIATELHNE